ncbi:hypothetical protein [Brevibacillus brevis]|uniref:hypothetical protein n=1 Tax=Brevibacillus brevis TaxID=1393 RepID=UPI0037C7FB55
MDIETAANIFTVAKVVGGIAGIIFMVSIIMLFMKTLRKRALLMLIISFLVSVLATWIQDELKRL